MTRDFSYFKGSQKLRRENCPPQPYVAPPLAMAMADLTLILDVNLVINKEHPLNYYDLRQLIS